MSEPESDDNEITAEHQRAESDIDMETGSDSEKSATIRAGDSDEIDLTQDNSTDRGHFPSTISSSKLKEAILTHRPCQPSGPFENNPDDENRPFFKAPTIIWKVKVIWKSKENGCVFLQASESLTVKHVGYLETDLIVTFSAYG